MKRTIFALFVSTFLSFPLLAKAQETSKDFQDGTVSYNKADYRMALQHFKDAINDDPDSWQSYEMEGHCYYYLSDLSDMKSAFEQSLQMHPDNPALTAYLSKLDQMPSQVLFTPTPQPNITLPSAPQDSAGASPMAAPTVAANNPSNHFQSFDFDIPKESFNFHIYTGADFSFMDDLINGLSNWAVYERSFSNVSGSSTNFSRFGFISGWEFKKAFGNHEISLGGQMITHSGGEADIDNTNGTVGKVILNPTVFELGLNYTFHFSPGGNFRPYLGLGAGYYFVDIQYSNPYPATPGTSPTGYYGQGDFDSSTIGGQATAGLEWSIDKCFSFDLLGRFRLATFSQLVSTNMSGSNVTAGTPYALEIDNNDLFYIPQSLIGQSGRRYAVLDYSGIDLMLGVHFYFGGDPLPKGQRKVKTTIPASSPANVQTGGWQGHDYYAPMTNPTPSSYVPSYAPMANPYH